VQAEGVEKLEGRRAGVVGVLSIWVDGAEEGWHQPLVDGCAGVGRVEVTQVQEHAYRGPEGDILQPGKEE
jgi:hypothetical protein